MLLLKLGHSLLPHQIQSSYSNLLNNLNVGLALSATFLLSILGIFAAVVLINELTDRIHRIEQINGVQGIRRSREKAKSSKRIGAVVSSFGVKRLSAIGILMLFVQLFLWLVTLFVSNNIQTNIIVVSVFLFGVSELRLEERS